MLQSRSINSVGWSSHWLGRLPSLQENEDTLNRAMAIRMCAGKAGPSPHCHQGPQEERDAPAPCCCPCATCPAARGSPLPGEQHATGNCLLLCPKALIFILAIQSISARLCLVSTVVCWVFLPSPAFFSLLAKISTFAQLSYLNSRTTFALLVLVCSPYLCSSKGKHFAHPPLMSKTHSL